MNAWVLYDRKRISINQRFAELLLKAFKKENVSAKLVVAENLNELPCEPFPDIVVNRSVNLPLTQTLESAGVQVWNNSEVARICNDKWETYQYLVKAGIRSLPAKLVSRKNLESIQLSFPVVLKSRDGHGGKEVYRIDSKERLKEAFFLLGKETALCQQFASNPGKDLRVYLLGKEILCGFLRESATDFRSNFSLGGKAICIDPLPANIVSQVKQISELFTFGLVGIDFIFDNGTPILNEIEDVVGTRMIYSKGNFNPAETYVQFIVREALRH